MAEVSAAEISFTKICVTQASIAEICITEIGIIKADGTQHGAMKICSAQVNPMKVGTNELSFSKICLSKVGVYFWMLPSPCIPSFYALFKYRNMRQIHHTVSPHILQSVLHSKDFTDVNEMISYNSSERGK